MISKKMRILFVCIHNSARSQMAVGIMQKKVGDEIIVNNAGLEPTPLNPAAIKVMQEIGIDISQNTTTKVIDRYKRGEIYNYVITLCDVENHEKCPVFPGITKMINWNLHDPITFTGTEEEIAHKMRELRDELDKRIDQFLAEEIRKK